MKILLRTALPALLTLVLADLSSPALVAQETPETGRLSANGWDIRVRPRLGMFLPQWDYAVDRRLPRRPTAGVEILVRRKDPRFGARLLVERTGAWRGSDLAGWGSSSLVPLAGPRPDWVGTVVADAVLYGFHGQDASPYVFLGGGSRLITREDVPTLLFSGSNSWRAMTLHGGVGFEVRVGGLWAVFEVGDYYGRFLEFGRVHDIHTTFLIGLPGFGDMIETVVTTLGGDPSEERH